MFQEAFEEPVRLPARTVEAAVLDGLRAHLRDPRAIAVFVKRYDSECARLAASAGQDRQKTGAQLEAWKREHEYLLKVYSEGFPS